MTTNVYFDGNWTMVQGQPNVFFKVLKFEEGIAEIDVPSTMDVASFARAVAGCFKPHSNFGKMMKKKFESTEHFRAIKFKFNDIPITVTKSNANAEKIIREYFSKL